MSSVNTNKLSDFAFNLHANLELANVKFVLNYQYERREYLQIYKMWCFENCRMLILNAVHILVINETTKSHNTRLKSKITDDLSTFTFFQSQKMKCTQILIFVVLCCLSSKMPLADAVKSKHTIRINNTNWKLKIIERELPS